MIPEDAIDTVLKHTVSARAWLVPELTLHLITHDCPLWTQGEDGPKKLGWQDPYWAFAWPGGQVLARHLLDHPELVRGKRVLDFGCGGAIEGIAALRAGAANVVCADIDPLALVAARLNAKANHVSLETTAHNQLESLSTPLPDVVLAGDMLYESSLASTVLHWLRTLATGGALVLVGDPARVPLSPAAFEEVAAYDAPFDGDIRAITLWRCRVLRVRPFTAKTKAT